MIVPVILSGGSGTRLWPLSTPQKPKQFLPLTGHESLFRQTLLRVRDRTMYASPVVIANAAHEQLCLAEMTGHEDDESARLILEPVPRNTAAAIVMAAEEVRRTSGEDTIILVMPSDHRIGEPDKFHGAVAAGVMAAKAGRLVTFGISPTGPETGYGYLESGASIEEAPGAFEVARFTEKPDRSIAEAMIATKRHFWNGGIFLYRVCDLLAEAQACAPEIYRCAVEGIARAKRDGQTIHPEVAVLEACPDMSVDYAIMERSSRIAMVSMDADWSDVGSWDALADLGGHPQERKLVSAVQSRNCYVRSDGLKVGLLGVDDLVVVAAGDQVLIMRKGQSQNIKELVAEVGTDR